MLGKVHMVDLLGLGIDHAHTVDDLVVGNLVVAGDIVAVLH